MNSHSLQTHFSCTILTCNKESQALCYCCQQNYCVEHLTEHNNSTLRQLNLLHNDIDKLDNEIRTFSIQPIIEDCRHKLEQWRAECHRNIDKIIEGKYQEIYRLIDEKVDHQRIELKHLQDAFVQLTNKQQIENYEVDSVRSMADELKIDFNNIKQLSNEIKTYSLQTDENVIRTRESYANDALNLSVIIKSMNYPDTTDGILTNNDTFTLIYLKPHLILLDKELNIVRQISWPYNKISSICWSSKIDRFIAITQKKIYFVDHQTLSMTKFKMSIEQAWSSCTCSNSSVFLTVREAKSPILEFSLLPSIKLMNEWKSPFTCQSHERIHNINYDDQKLALMITNVANRSVRLELRSSKTLDFIWSLQLNITYDPHKRFQCCSFRGHRWLVTDYEQQRILHITSNGQVEETISYDSRPICIALCAGSNTLAVLRNRGINFHKL